MHEQNVPIVNRRDDMIGGFCATSVVLLHTSTPFGSFVGREVKPSDSTKGLFTLDD